MPRSCNVLGCRGNYPGEPYSKVVKFPNKDTDYAEWDRWLCAMPNERASLEKLKEIWICRSHFDCEWQKVRGGERPVSPPSIFPGIPKSCFKQTVSKPRPTSATSEKRAEIETQRREEEDKIKDFDDFCQKICVRYPNFNIIPDEGGTDIYLSRTDVRGQKVTRFLHFRSITSHFGFLYFVTGEKDGTPVPKGKFSLQKNSLVSRWTQMDDIVSVIDNYEIKNDDRLKIILESFDKMEELHGSAHFQFLRAQLELLLTAPKGRRFDKQILVVAAEIYGISPAAYKMIYRSGVLAIPSVATIKKLLRASFNDDNLAAIFKELKTQQRLVNVLFDEVKLISTLRFTGGHALGYAQNSSQISTETLATHALVIEIVCHHGGPRYILRVRPVAKLKADDLKKILQEAMLAIIKAGGRIMSLVCDNCPTNQGVYRILGGPGKVHFENIGMTVFLVYDYVHIFKNIRNNWITVLNKMLSFEKDGKTLIASWADVQALYEEDRLTTLRLTKLTHTSVFPKPLQRQSVPLVCQVFNDKTVAAMVSLQKKLLINDGTIEFIRMVTNWFHMMNVKDKYSGIHSRDKLRSPWTLGCESFDILQGYCDVISTCAWTGGRGRTLKLTKSTSSAFIVSTRSNVEAATLLLTTEKFNYVLPAVFADEVLEKFFGNTRMRFSGNFYIDYVDVIASARVVNLHAMLKYDLLPNKNTTSAIDCVHCSEYPSDDDIESLNDFELGETQSLLLLDDTLRHKVVFIAGHLVHKYGTTDDENDEDISSEFLDELNRGGLSVPTISTVHFVHSAFSLVGKVDAPRYRCRKYLTKLFGLINAQLASNSDACRTLANIILKAFVLDNSDREREMGCLRRKEKLSDKQ